MRLVYAMLVGYNRRISPVLHQTEYEVLFLKVLGGCATMGTLYIHILPFVLEFIRRIYLVNNFSAPTLWTRYRQFKVTCFFHKFSYGVTLQGLYVRMFGRELGVQRWKATQTLRICRCIHTFVRFFLVFRLKQSRHSAVGAFAENNVETLMLTWWKC